MPVNPQFLAARAAEHRQRLLCYSPVAEPMRLLLANGRTVAVPQRHLTLRALVELELVGNPFVVRGRATPWDAYRVLWRLHPAFLRRSEPASLGARLRASFTRYRLAWLTGRLLWPASGAILQERVAILFQDASAGKDESPRTGPAAPPTCTPDYLCHFFSQHYRFSREQVLDAPIAWLLQLLRAATLAGPDGMTAVIDPSDQLLSRPAVAP